MKKMTKKDAINQRSSSWIFLTFFAVIAVLLIISAYLHKVSQDKVANHQVNQSPLPETKKQSVFQSLLTKECEDAAIEIDKLPFSLDLNTIGADDSNAKTVNCGIEPQSHHLFIRLKDNSYVYVYDQFSEQIGTHNSSWGPDGVAIKNNENEQFFTFIRAGSGPFIIDFAKVDLRAEKKLTVGKDPIMVSYSTLAIPINDKRLVDFLKPYEVPLMPEDPNTDYHIYPLPDQAMKDKFFSDLSKVGNPEKLALKKLEKVLSGFTEVNN